MGGDRPEPGKVYRLIGGADTPAISNGDSWEASEVVEEETEPLCWCGARLRTPHRDGHRGHFR